MSAALSLQKSVKNNAEELQDYMRDLNNWIEDIKKQDDALVNEKNGLRTNEDLPPIRRPTKTKLNESSDKNKKVKIKNEQKSRISSYDYAAWDKFDVEEALKSDSEEYPVGSDSALRIQETPESSAVTESNKEKAEVFKKEGNHCYSQGKYLDAVAKYTRGIALDPSNPLLPANRAMAYLKLEKFKAAVKDCTRSIDLDPVYIKSFMRRATARKNLNDFVGACEDYKKVLELEPWNKEAKMEMERITKEIKKSTQSKSNDSEHLLKSTTIAEATSQKTESKSMKKIHIEQVSSSTAKIEAIPSKKGRSVSSTKELRSIPIIEVKDRVEMDSLLRTEVNNKEEMKENEIKEEMETKDKREIQEKEIKSYKSVDKNNTVMDKEEEVINKSTEQPCSKPSLPRSPKTSHQFSQDWRKIREFLDLKTSYLKSIQDSFFTGIEIDVDLLVDIVATLNAQDFDSKEASDKLVALTKSLGFYLNISFLDDSQKKVFMDVIAKLKDYSESLELMKLKEAILEP